MCVSIQYLSTIFWRVGSLLVWLPLRQPRVCPMDKPSLLILHSGSPVCPRDKHSCPGTNLGAFFWDRTSLSIAKNHAKTSQEFFQQFGPSTHKLKGFSKNSHQKVHPNFAKILGRQILGNTLSGPNFLLANLERYSIFCIVVVL